MLHPELFDGVAGEVIEWLRRTLELEAEDHAADLEREALHLEQEERRGR